MSDSETNAIMHMLGRLEGKLDGILNKQAEQDHRLNTHSDRLTRLEKSKMWLIGAAAGVGAAVSYLPKIFEGAN